MELEIYPEINKQSHETLRLYLEKLLNNKINNNNSNINNSNINKTITKNIIIEKYNYIAYYSDKGVFDIYNNKIHKNSISDIQKKSLHETLPFIVKYKNDYLITQLYVNYTINNKKTDSSVISMSQLPFHHFSERHTKYTLSLSRQSKTKTELIFNKNKLVNAVFYIELPKTNVNDDTIHKTHIIDCIQNNENDLYNVYNECFYSLYSLIINML